MSNLQIERDVFKRNERTLPGSPEGLVYILETTEWNRGGLVPPPRIDLCSRLNIELPLKA
jgi:hypothetical protein